jgi:NADH-quinone oxidoreductase subunit M
MLQRVFTGPTNERHLSMPDLSRRETLIVVPLLILVFWAGISPKTWLLFSQLIP